MYFFKAQYRRKLCRFVITVSGYQNSRITNNDEEKRFTFERKPSRFGVTNAGQANNVFESSTL